MKIDASEIRTLAADLSGVGSTAAMKAGLVVRKTAKDIEATAKKLVPVDTGLLRNSIRTSSRSTSVDTPSAEVRASTEYARFVEVGTSRMAAQPYMNPAADTHEPAFVEAMKQLIDGEL